MGLGTRALVLGVLVAGVAGGGGPVAWAQADPPGCTRTAQGTGERIECTEGVPAGITLRGTDGDDEIVITGRDGADTPRYGERGGVGNAGTVDSGEGVDTITITGGTGGNALDYTLEDGDRPADFRGGNGGHGNTGSIITGGGTTTVTITGGRGRDTAFEGGRGGQGGDGWAATNATLSTTGTLNMTITGGDGGNGGPVDTSTTLGGGGDGGDGIAANSRLTVTGSSPVGATLTALGGNGGDGATLGERVRPGGVGGSGAAQVSQTTMTPNNDVVIAGAGTPGSPAPSTIREFSLIGARVDARDGDDSVITMDRTQSSTVVCGRGNNDTYLYETDPASRRGCETVGRQ
ncbi:hypothetical protein GCM10009634_74370 [Saccharothrix xinjiangensis]